MALRIQSVVLTIAVLSSGGVLAQVPTEGAVKLEDVPCVIDAQLSLWLALESVDRTIAALEAERLDLADSLAIQLRALDVLARADDSDGVPLAEMSALMLAKSVGRAALEDAYAQIQSRLIEIEKTLNRRSKHQAMLETQVETLIESSGRQDG